LWSVDAHRRALDNLLENAARYADQAQPVALRGRVDGLT
jgi:K+-sensing histidine kinase KdpD